MEANVHCFMLLPHRARETVATQWKNVERRVRWDAAWPHGIQETFVMEWKHMDSSVHCFTVQPQGTQVDCSGAMES